MSDGLTLICNMSLTGSAVIILVLVLRFCMRRVPKHMLCFLWLIPFARLLLPISIEAPFSLLPVNPRPVAGITIERQDVPVVSTGIEAIDIPVNLVLINHFASRVTEGTEENHALYRVAEMIWAAGLLLFLGENVLLPPLAFGGNHVRSRIKHILSYRRPAHWGSLCMGIVLIFAAAVLLTDPKEAASIGIIGGADGPTSVFLAGKLGGNRNREEEHSMVIGGADGPTAVFIAGTSGGGRTAETLNLEEAAGMPYGTAVELDYVHAGAISLHGSFGYLSFRLESDRNDTVHAKLKRAVSLSEIGELWMQGDGYTEILGGENGAVILMQPYSPGEEGKRVYLYSETENTIEEADTDEFKEMLAEYTGQRLLADAPIDGEALPELSACLAGQYEAPVLYGPVVIPEFDSEVYGFLASDGENLEDLWYGIWDRSMERIRKIPLFE